MHDNSALVERRIRRELTERVLPAVYRAVAPMTVEAWEVPGEPVAYLDAMEGLATEGRPFTIGDQFGRPWGTTWFRFTADVPGSWVGPGLEAVIDFGFHPDAAGFQSEGLVWEPGPDGRGLPVQGIHPRRAGVPLPTATAGPIELIVEAASNPVFPMNGARTGTSVLSPRQATSPSTG